MKNKVLTFLIIIIMFGILAINTSCVRAETLSGDNLLEVNGKKITKTTTIDEINNMFGTPKITTDSAFGGKAYSYYDDEYTWYMHIETNSSGSIKAYGAILGNFKAREYSYGDEASSSYSYLSGTTLKDWDESRVYGRYEYNCTSNDVSTYWENYESQSDKYLYDIQKHSIAASKVLSKMDGDEFIQTYASEDIFYISEQLKYNGTNLYDWARDNGKTRYISLTSAGSDGFYEKLPNPIYLGNKAVGYANSTAHTYFLYDIEITNTASKSGYTRFLFIDPNFTEEKKKIELNDTEKVLLELVNKEYETYNQHGQSITSTYIEEPNYTSLPLSAGQYSEEALLMATDWINLARVGLGLGKLELDLDIADAAQHKAALVYYIGLSGVSAGHFPEQPEGVSDEFYNKAQSYMTENLYSGTIQSSIDGALNDAYGDPVSCGHRYNLLWPSSTKWGVGAVGSGVSWGWQAAHKFSGYTSYENELVAWPSNGIFPLDLVGNGIGNWTAYFFKNYDVSSETEVTIKCLNTDKVYEITNENKNSSGKLLKVTGDYLLTFRDDSVTYENGDVFEITLHNVKNSAGENVDYTYRSVFLSLYEESGIKVEDIELNKEDVTLTIGSNYRILAKVAPEDAKNKLMKFSSLNEDILSVRQDGTITAKKVGTTQISVKSGDVEKLVNVEVTDRLKGDMNNDGKVNSIDSALVLDKYKYSNATQEDIAVGDMNGDEKLNSIDAAAIIDMYKNSN